ncbi:MULTISPECIES: PilX N-terminal domain-containing pilus assembly protein [unclassified Acinetobacter]|uniref:pilus assembly PilX family protein n=1 Tax=Acinetobacter TaxID=469 RepID=UPI0015D41591|nr:MULTISPECIES: pilus assembly PilX N-terminal domain-containing protein [unclassified Acinetobacter]UUS57309.1 pilus assembly protein PilX [Acinetobacter sp. YH16040_T]
MLNRQKGATLIVVLILLVALTVIGTLAIRQSLVSLNIATNGQAQQLLIQNSDSATFNVENPNNLIRSLARDGMFGFIKGSTNKGKELIFCYRGDQSQFFNLSRASLIYEQNGSIVNNSLGVSGYCQLGSQNFFTSNRRAVLTQVSVSFVEGGNVKPFQFYIRGTDPEKAKIEQTERVVVNTVSLIPSLSTATDEEINTCLSTRLSNTDIPAHSIATCLSRLNVPFTVHVTEYTLGQAFI